MIYTESDSNGFLRLTLTDEMIRQAHKREREMFAKYGKAGTVITEDKDSRMTGYIAEAGVKAWYPAFKYTDRLWADLILGGVLFDVKGTGVNVKPAPHYICYLYPENAERIEAKWLIFCQVTNNRSVMWVCGFITLTEFLEKATLVRAGQRSGQYHLYVDRLHLKLGELVRPKAMMPYLDALARKEIADGIPVSVDQGPQADAHEAQALRQAEA